MLPDKRRSFQEVYRVLKDGGEVALSDIALKGSFSKDTYGEIRHYLNDFDYCFRALDIQEYISLLDEIGFVDIRIIEKKLVLTPFIYPSIYVVSLKMKK